MRYLLGALPLVIAANLSCGSSSDPAPAVNDGLSRSDLLASVTDRVLVPTYEQLETQTAALVTATEAWESAPTDTSRQATAQQAFQDAMAVMQRAELMQVGPAGLSSSYLGGLGLRDQLYSWPATNACRVDQELVEEAYTTSAFFENELVNVFGFDALEYLLFVNADGNSCAQPTPINRDGTWNALGSEVVNARRAAYAASIARQLAANATELKNAWTQGARPFADEFRNAGSTDSVYSSAQTAINDLYASMFYLDRQVKDAKLGAPLGITPVCREGTCPELFESNHAEVNAASLQANIEAFAQLYYGGDKDNADAVGFDDLLRESGATQLADDLDTRIENMVDTSMTLEDPMVSFLEASPESVRASYDAVKLVTDLFKSQFVSVLNLRLPMEGAADND